MPALLADVNCDGAMAALLQVCRSKEWQMIWEPLAVRCLSFEDVSLNRELPVRICGVSASRKAAFS
jgi:hypothetical protein